LQSLIQHNDVDYRLIYLLEDIVQRRISDIYLSHSSRLIPPFFEEIIFDMCDVAVLLFAERVKELAVLNNEDMRHVNEIAKTGDPELAVSFLQRHAPETFLDEFQRDIYLYLLANNLNFFKKPFNRLEASFRESRLFNPTIIQVW
jgi:hypothetical protein